MLRDEGEVMTIFRKFAIVGSVALLFLLFQNCAQNLPDEAASFSSSSADGPGAAQEPVDTSTPTSTVVPLVASFQPATISVSQTSTLSVSGGSAPYLFGILEGLASVNASGVVSPSGVGQVKVVVNDSAGQSVTVHLIVNADPLPPTATFNVTSSSCNGARCGGGYEGRKDSLSQAQVTLDYLCSQNNYSVAINFTISTSQPGGRYCSRVNGGWTCDPSCSGCNPVTSVTCSSPVQASSGN